MTRVEALKVADEYIVLVLGKNKRGYAQTIAPSERVHLVLRIAQWLLDVSE